MAAHTLGHATPGSGSRPPEPNGRAHGAAPSCWCVRRAGATRAHGRGTGDQCAVAAADGPGLRCLVVDIKPSERDDLAAMLRARACVGRVNTASDAIEALRLLGQADIDIAFVEVRIPGLDGHELAGVLGRLRGAPAVVLFSRHARRETDPIESATIAYLRKPALPDRLTASLRWAATHRSAAALCGPGPDGSAGRISGRGGLSGGRPLSGSTTSPVEVNGPLIPVDVGRTTRLIPLSAVRWAEASRDYVRLYTADGGHLIRARMNALADTWQPYGDLVRIHRSYMVGLRFVSQLRMVRSGQFAVIVDGRELPVSRSYLPQVRHLLPAPP